MPSLWVLRVGMGYENFLSFRKHYSCTDVVVVERVEYPTSYSLANGIYVALLCFHSKLNASILNENKEGFRVQEYSRDRCVIS